MKEIFQLRISYTAALKQHLGDIHRLTQNTNAKPRFLSKTNKETYEYS